jgi:hypothetical protein
VANQGSEFPEFKQACFHGASPSVETGPKAMPPRIPIGSHVDGFGATLRGS